MSNQGPAMPMPSRQLLLSLIFLFTLPSAFAAELLVADKGQLALPSGDLVAPEVVHEAGGQVLVPGQPYSIQVKATDNVGVKQVLLFYRVIGGGDYKRIKMENSGESNYGVTLPGTEVAAPGIEYYVQTEDLAGNTLLTGYSFSPLVVKANSSDVIGGSDSTETAGAFGERSMGEESIWKNKWVWIGIAAVAGAAIAANSGGDSPSANPGGDTVQVTACFPDGSTTC